MEAELLNKFAYRVDSLIAGGISFALYRLHDESDFTFVMQKDKGESTYESLNATTDITSGFILAPFENDGRYPVIVIRNDITACGAEEILSATDDIKLCDGYYPEFTDESTADPKEGEEIYTKAFESFMAALQKGEFKKLVLSRCEKAALPQGFSCGRAFLRALSECPGMTVSLICSKKGGVRLGATPETLLRGRGNTFETMSLAGTMMKNADGSCPAFEEWSEKNRHEQQIVTEYIGNILKSYASETEESKPYSSGAGNVAHLRTDFKFTISDTRQLTELCEKLHPTPAVCGMPKKEASCFIRKHEGYERNYYAGLIGPVNIRNKETALFVNLRCMRLDKDFAVLYAGGGIVKGSDRDAEFEETVRKMQAMRRLLENAD